MKPWQGLALAGPLFLFRVTAGATDIVQFEDLDRNGDNQLSGKEARRFDSFDFAIADRDRNGFISEREFDLAVGTMMNADNMERSTAPLPAIRRSSVAGTNSVCCKAYSG
jgi:hypothetical protein